MFARALIAFLALPGVVAFAVPIVLLWRSDHASLKQPLGLVPLAGGLLGLLWCVRDFYVAGKGTLAPWSPPLRLVVVGLYRYSRNPMYVSVGLILIGWAISFASLSLCWYALAVVVAFHLRVLLAEEPWLARTFGDAWKEYRSRVPRWLF
jgi:protein-S-isoprenylcysteine O-methyltransferase Ste14